MITREKYLSAPYDETGKVHQAYYGQFVTDDVKDSVLRHIPLATLKASKDTHLNDIGLGTWDRVQVCRADAMRALGDFPTSAGNVCIAKEAARQILESLCQNCGLEERHHTDEKCLFSSTNYARKGPNYYDEVAEDLRGAQHGTD
jgi:hypothetical protein